MEEATLTSRVPPASSAPEQVRPRSRGDSQDPVQGSIWLLLGHTESQGVNRGPGVESLTYLLIWRKGRVKAICLSSRLNPLTNFLLTCVPGVSFSACT